MKKTLIIFSTIFSSVNLVTAQTMFESRTQLILNAFNSKPEDLIRPLIESDVKLGQQDGRVDVNDTAKFSYYVDIKNMNDINSLITLIPMATSRYTPTYYQTDEFWNEHKDEMEKVKREGRPAPRQDMNEVATWLSEMKLSTNPDVIIIDPLTKSSIRKPLQIFLFEHYIDQYEKNGYITLFRGAEKAGEFELWNRKEMPKGVRYWTPTANYAWRYARKNTNFFDDLINGKAPLFKFKIPVKDFKDMVIRSWPRLTLGTELTKSVHRNFDSYRKFSDDLANGQAYLGEGIYGLEFELRANKAGALDMTKYFAGAADIDDLVEDRINVLQKTLARLKRKNIEKSNELDTTFLNRIKNVNIEQQIIASIVNKTGNDETLKSIQKITYGLSEITNIVGFNFSSWANKKINDLKISREKTTEAKNESKAESKILSCKGLF